MKKIDKMLKEISYPVLTEEDLKVRLEQLMKNREINSIIDKYKLTEEFLLANLVSLQEFISEEEAYKKTGSSKAVPGFKPILVYHNNNLYVEYQKTKQNDILIAQQRKTFLDIPKVIRSASLNNIDEDVTKNNFDLINYIYDYVQSLSLDPEKFQKGLYIWGDFGRGKTYLMGAVVNYLTNQGIQSVMLNTSTFISDLRANFDKGNHYVNNQIRRMQTVPFLVLDDIGAENITSWSRDDVLSVILQYRMQEELPTCFTSNLSLKQLEQHFSETRDQVDKIKAKRIMERIYYLANEYQILGNNKRH